MTREEEFDQQALVDALTAAGSPAELGDEQRYREMFQAAQPAPGPRRLVVAPPRRTAVRRLSTGASLAVVVALASGGVAAAYSSKLPDPVQRAVHSVLSPIGVPDTEPQRQVVQARQSPDPAPTPPPPTTSTPPSAPPVTTPSELPSSTEAPSPSETVEPSPTLEPAAPATSTVPSEGPTDVAPSTAPASPTSSPSPTGSAEPTNPAPSSSTSPSSPTSPASPTTAPTPDAPVPSAVDVSSAGAGGKVAQGGTAVVAGRVRAGDGTPVRGVLVYLQQRAAGGWQRVAAGRTAPDGSVALVSRPVQRSTAVRLTTGKVRSTSRQLTVQPTVSATAQTVDGVSTVTATITGGTPGDRVQLRTTREGQVVVEGQATLDGGGVRFYVAAPTTDRWYVVQLPATAAHAAAQVRVLVPAGAPQEPGTG